MERSNGATPDEVKPAIKKSAIPVLKRKRLPLFKRLAHFTHSGLSQNSSFSRLPRHRVLVSIDITTHVSIGSLLSRVSWAK